MSTIKDDIKIADELFKYRRKCKNCGHVMTFYRTSYRDKIICTHCGKYVYKNDSIEFREKIKEATKKDTKIIPKRY